MDTERGCAKTVLYELERAREFGLTSRVVLQNYELIRLALIEYAERGAERNGDAAAGRPWQRDPTGW